jgi:hypothetical protein
MGLKMRRRRLMLGVGLVTLVLAGTGSALLLLAPPDPISPEGAARIEVGMTEEDVERVLGGEKAGFGIGGLWHWTAAWGGDDGEVVVCFTEGRVSEPAWFNRESFLSRPASRTPLGRLRAWLGW